MLWHQEVEPAFRKLFDEQWRLSRAPNPGNTPGPGKTPAPVSAKGGTAPAPGSKAQGSGGCAYADLGTPARGRGRDWLDEVREDAAEAACCPVTWLMPGLMDLIARTAEQPIDTVRAEVRALLTEQDFNGVTGDAVHDARHRELVELYVDRLTRTIDRIRALTAPGTVPGTTPGNPLTAAGTDPSCFFG